MARRTKSAAPSPVQDRFVTDPWTKYTVLVRATGLVGGATSYRAYVRVEHLTSLEIAERFICYSILQMPAGTGSDQLWADLSGSCSPRLAAMHADLDRGDDDALAIVGGAMARDYYWRLVDRWRRLCTAHVAALIALAYPEGQVRS